MRSYHPCDRVRAAEAPLLAPGQRVFVLHGADGGPILLAGSREAAIADAASRQIETLSIH